MSCPYKSFRCNHRPVHLLPRLVAPCKHKHRLRPKGRRRCRCRCSSSWINTGRLTSPLSLSPQSPAMHEVRKLLSGDCLPHSDHSSDSHMETEIALFSFLLLVKMTHSALLPCFLPSFLKSSSSSLTPHRPIHSPIFWGLFSEAAAQCGRAHSLSFTRGPNFLLRLRPRGQDDEAADEQLRG